VQPLALVAASLGAFRVLLVGMNAALSFLICLVFSTKFNIMTTLFVHQSQTLPQKIDSREGLF